MYIYKTTNLTNGKVYIGKSEKDFNREYLGSGVLLSKAIKKYGKENFKVELIETCNTIEDLNNREKFWITENIGKDCYNIAEGGTGGWTIKNYNSKQLKKYKLKLSIAGKNREPMSDETRKKLSDANSGRFEGDAEVISNTIKKLWKDPNSIYNSLEYRKRLSDASKKRKWTDETKRKISESRLGSKNWSATKIGVDDVIYETIKECAEEYKISPTAVSKRCKSKNFPNWKKYEKKEKKL